MLRKIWISCSNYFKKKESSPIHYIPNEMTGSIKKNHSLDFNKAFIEILEAIFKRERGINSLNDSISYCKNLNERLLEWITPIVRASF